MVFEVILDAVEVTDVTLRPHRDGEKVGSVHDDHGTAKTMAHLTTPGDDSIASRCRSRSSADCSTSPRRPVGSRRRGDPETHRLRTLDPPGSRARTPNSLSTG